MRTLWPYRHESLWCKWYYRTVCHLSTLISGEPAENTCDEHYDRNVFTFCRYELMMNTTIVMYLPSPVMTYDRHYDRNVFTSCRYDGHYDRNVFTTCRLGYNLFVRTWFPWDRGGETPSPSSGRAKVIISTIVYNTYPCL